MNYWMSTDKQTWDRFVSKSPQGNVFCTSAFLDAMTVEYELVGLEEAGRIVMGAIVLKDGEKVVTSPFPLTMYQGVLCCAETAAMPHHKRSRWLLDALSLLLAEMEGRFDRISFCLSHAWEDARAFQWFHYHDRDGGVFRIDLRYTGLLDLRETADLPTYMARVRSVRRQEYRKAKSAGFVVTPEADVDLLNRLHGLTFARQGIEREEAEERMVIAVARAALERDFGELLVCRDGTGRPAAATLFLYDECTGYYYISATDPEYRASGCGTLLVMENIQRCMQRHVSTVDFVGINSPNRGDFKTSFDARPVPYLSFTWEKAPR